MEELEENSQKSTLEIVQDIAEFANAVASLLVGHRSILVGGGFDTDIVDNMCAGLHAKLLGLVDDWGFDSDVLIFVEEEDDSD